ncbi:MAG: S41 family peptidase [Candidatus Nanopelagicaceae bacterium]
MARGFNTRRPRVSANSLRASSAIFIVMVIVFSLGYYLGGKNSDGPVDQAISKISSAGHSAADKSTLQRAAIEGALRASGDQWSNFFPKSAVDILDAQINSQYTGVGLTLRKAKSGAIEVAGVDTASPADLAGIKVGDEVVAINKADVTGSSLSSVIAMLRGESGTRVSFEVLREGKKFSLTVKRDLVNATNVIVSSLASDVAIVSINSFTHGVANSVQSKLLEVPHTKGIVLDLRSNPGGLLDEAVAVARQFINGGTIVSYQKADGTVVGFDADKSGADPAPMIVLINRSTASAAEVLAAALQDRNRAVVIGEKSYGKGSVQEITTLNDGSKLELTIANYRAPSGRLIEGIGITPDLRVADSDLAEKSLSILAGLSSLIEPSKP